MGITEKNLEKLRSIVKQFNNTKLKDFYIDCVWWQNNTILFVASVTCYDENLKSKISKTIFRITFDLDFESNDISRMQIEGNSTDKKNQSAIRKIQEKVTNLMKEGLK